MSPRSGIWRLAAAIAVAILVNGCGGDGGGGSGGGCHPAEDLASAEADPVADADAALRALLGLAASVRGAPDVAADIAPAASPGYQSLETGRAAKWEVAVLQLADRPRTLEVVFPDGGGGVSREVPAGTGACVFEVSHSFDEPASRRVVRFTLAGQGNQRPSFEAFVDVVPKG